MKKEILFLFTFYLFIGTPLKSQTLNTKEIIIMEDLAKDYFESQTYKHIDNPNYILHTLSEDFVIDKRGSFYFVNDFTKVIYKYDQKGKLLFKLKIPDKNFNNEKITIDNLVTMKEDMYQTKLGIDRFNNLYILLLYTEYFYRLIKFDESGKIIENFNLEKPWPGRRNTHLFIGYDKIYIKTFPATIIDPKYTDEGLVFVYKLDGNFIGRTDYYLEDNNDNIYKRLSKRGEFVLQKFKNENEEYLLKTANLKRIGEINIKHKKSVKFISREDRWLFKGIDIYNNIYLYNEIIIKKYDRNTNLIKEIPFSLKELKTDNILTDSKYIRISSNGDIFAYGIKTSEQINMQKTYNNSSDIYVVVIHLKKDE